MVWPWDFYFVRWNTASIFSQSDFQGISQDVIVIWVNLDWVSFVHEIEPGHQILIFANDSFIEFQSQDVDICVKCILGRWADAEATSEWKSQSSKFNLDNQRAIETSWAIFCLRYEYCAVFDNESLLQDFQRWFSMIFISIPADKLPIHWPPVVAKSFVTIILQHFCIKARFQANHHLRKVTDLKFLFLFRWWSAWQLQRWKVLDRSREV